MVISLMALLAVFMISTPLAPLGRCQALPFACERSIEHLFHLCYGQIRTTTDKYGQIRTRIDRRGGGNWHIRGHQAAAHPSDREIQRPTMNQYQFTCVEASDYQRHMGCRG